MDEEFVQRFVGLHPGRRRPAQVGVKLRQGWMLNHHDAKERVTLPCTQATFP